MNKSKLMKTIIFIVVLLIPIIYSFFYLKSYWNPYGDLTGMKIAVVNLDKGEDGTNQGAEFVQGLKDSATFDICEVTLDEANKGMQDDKYYATITVPSNFTEYLNSASSKDKRIATITYSPNQAANYLGTQIINSAVKTIELNLEEKINSEISEKLAQKLEDVPNSLEDISNGAGQILDGSQDLSSGLAKLNDGTTTLNNSYNEFDEGIKSAYQGSVAVDTGVQQVSAGTSDLQAGSKKLDDAITQINAGVDQLSTQGGAGVGNLSSGIAELNQGAEMLNTGVNAYVDGTTELVTNVNGYVTAVNNLIDALEANGITNPNFATIKGFGTQITTGASGLTLQGPALKTGAQGVVDGTVQLAQGASGLTKITDGIGNIKLALTEVKGGTQTLKDGTITLSNGTNTLKNGTGTLSNGLLKLDNSSTTVKNALQTLNDGTQSAYQGSQTLVDGVQTFKTEVDNGIDDAEKELKNLDGIKEFSENPVTFETEAYGEVDTYGIAFTPLFLCIGLWVGALMAYVVLYYDQKNRYNKMGSTSKNKFLQNALYLAIGAVQGLITAMLLKAGLKYDVQNIGLYYFSSILIGIAFMSIIQFLIRNFGDIGKFMALIILVLQLAASGGTFPVETIDKAFQGVSAFLPMTYSIKLFREILVPTETNFKAKYIIMLFVITIFNIAVTYCVDIIKDKKQKEITVNK